MHTIAMMMHTDEGIDTQTQHLIMTYWLNYICTLSTIQNHSGLPQGHIPHTHTNIEPPTHLFSQDPMNQCGPTQDLPDLGVCWRKCWDPVPITPLLPLLSSCKRKAFYPAPVLIWSISNLIRQILFERGGGFSPRMWPSLLPDVE